MTICVPPNKIRVIREIRVQQTYASRFNINFRVLRKIIRKIREIRVQNPYASRFNMTICVPLSPYNPLSPEEMPDSEERFAQSLCGKIPHQTHIPV